MPDLIDHTIEVLNRINKADPTVLPALISYRVPCNEAVGDDPTVQVGRVGETWGDWEVGFLGILNGIFGANETGWGYIVANMEDGAITHFHRLAE